MNNNVKKYLIGGSLLSVAVGALVYLYKEKNIEARLKDEYIESLFEKDDSNTEEPSNKRKSYVLKKGVITSLYKKDKSNTVEIEFEDESKVINKINVNEKNINLINTASKDCTPVYVSYNTVFIPEGVPMNPIGKHVDILEFKLPHKHQIFTLIIIK